jgi:hypothetical protein
LPEPSVAAQECGGGAAAAPQPPAAGQPPEARVEDWDIYVGCPCEARHLASGGCVQLWQGRFGSGARSRPSSLCEYLCGGSCECVKRSGQACRTIDKDGHGRAHLRGCDVLYDDGDVEKGVLLKYVREPLATAAAAPAAGVKRGAPAGETKAKAGASQLQGQGVPPQPQP